MAANPPLFGGEAYWNQLYFADEILETIRQYGFPPHAEYDFKRGVYPEDQPINCRLKYVEAHIWSDEALDKYRRKWREENEISV